MPFDLSSSTPVDPEKPAKGGFDLASRKPVGGPPAAATPDDDTGILATAGKTARNAIGAVAEPVMNLLSGAIAKPVSDIAGLAATGKELVAPTPGGGDPAGFKREVQDRLTYEPRTAAGKAVTEYNPLALLGKGVSAVGDAAGRGVDKIPVPPSLVPARAAASSGVAEAVKQAPGFLGAKGIPAAAEAGAGALKTGARDLMQSALKPGEKARRTGKGEEAIDTLLDTGTNVTKGGADKLQTRITELNNNIAQRIENSPASIDKKQVAESLRPVIKKFAYQVNHLDDIKAIQKAYEEFMSHPLLQGDAIPVQTAQKMKQGTSKALGDKAYGELKSADIEAQKALQNGLREEIAKAVPQVRQLNAEESKLINALSLVEKRALLEANKNPIGLGLLSLSPSHMLGFMADRSGLFKSIVARMLNTGSQAVGATAKMGAPLGAALNAETGNQIPPPPAQ